MKTVFFGTPPIAVTSLDAVFASTHEVTAVVTRPDRLAGRGRRVSLPPVKVRALELGLPVYQPEKAREVLPALMQTGAEVFVVVAYGGWLPPAVLDAVKHGCVNLHPSLLPRWRGAAPVERALIAGDPVTGVTIMRLDKGLDTGPLLLQAEHPIQDCDTAGDLLDRLGEVGAELLVQALDCLEKGQLVARPQPEGTFLYAEKLTPEECRIDWKQSATSIDRLVRGANPRPGAWTTLSGRRCKIWAGGAFVGEAPHGDPGEIVADSPLLVQTGAGAYRVDILQADGRSRMDAAAYARGHALACGSFC